MPQGERRLQVDIAGDEVTGAVKLIHIPEEWQRQQRAADVAVNGLSILRVLTLLGMVIAGAIAAIVSWSRGRFSVRYFLVTSLTTLLAGAALVGNTFPAVTTRFSTAQPFAVQGAVTLVLLALLVCAAAVAAGLVAGMVIPWRQPRASIRSGELVLAGLLWAIAISCLLVFTVQPFGAAAPAWPGTSAAVSVIPLLDPVISNLIAYCLYTLSLLLVFSVTDRHTGAWTLNRGMAFALLFLLGAICYGSTAAGSLTAWAVSALAMGLAVASGYSLLIRHDLAVIPVITAASLVLDLLPLTEPAYPGAHYGDMLAIVVIIGIGWLSFRTLRRGQST